MTALETRDPRQAIRDKEVSTRAAAARDLGRIGTWDDMPVLIELATGPRSSAAVKVYTAAAACDIAHRLRLHDGLDAAQQDQLLSWATSFDPDDNPGLLMLMSAVAPKKVLSRLGRMMRGQRTGVRAGAANALLRMAAPRVALTATEPRASVGKWLLDRNFQRHADTLEALIRLVGDCGFVEHESNVRAVQHAARGLGEAVEQTLERLEAQRDVSAWTGVYLCDGRDVSEVGESQPLRWLVVHEGAIYVDDAVHTLTLTEGVAVDGVAQEGRLGWFNRQGTTEASQRALQLLDATWWQASRSELTDRFQASLESGETGLPAGALLGLAAQLEALQMSLLAAVARLRGGDAAGAVALLDALLEGKKPKAEGWFWRGLAHRDNGDVAAAREDLERFLAKGGKRAPHRAAAQAALADLP